MSINLYGHSEGGTTEAWIYRCDDDHKVRQKQGSLWRGHFPDDGFRQSYSRIPFNVIMRRKHYVLVIEY